MRMYVCIYVCIWCMHDMYDMHVVLCICDICGMYVCMARMYGTYDMRSCSGYGIYLLTLGLGL